MFLFRRELDLSSDTIQALQRFCLFVAVVYVQFWNQCSIVVDAPINDLKFLQTINEYKKIDRYTALAAKIAFERHLWYLGEELVILSLFSKKVSNDDKDMINILLIRGGRMTRRTCNSLRYQEKLTNVENLSLHSFVSLRSNFLLERLDLDTSFFEECAEEWPKMESYRNAEKIVSDLLISVNDGSERLLRRAELIINNQKVRSETALQNAIVSLGMKQI